MRTDFNLVKDQWIRLVGHEPVGLLELFDFKDAPMLAGTPVQKLILFRFLLAIVQCACPLEDEDEYQAMTVEDMKARVRDYLTKQTDGFLLFDSDRPFLQHPGILENNDKKTFPLSAFMPGVCTGNATLLFAANSSRPSLDEADVVYTLLSLVTFGMGGKKPDKSLVFTDGLVKKSAPASPALGRGWLHSFPMSSDLYKSLKLNIVTGDMLAEPELSFLPGGIGTPPWEKMPSTEAGPDAVDYTKTLVGWLVPISRFCRIFGENVCMTSGVVYPSVSDSICDLSVSLREANKKVTAVRARTDVAPWRQLDAVLAFSGANETEGCKALKLIRESRQDDLSAVWCVGLQVSEQSGEQYMSNTDDFIESRFAIEPGWEDRVFFKRYTDEMTWINKVKKKLWVCVTNYYQELQAGDLGSKTAGHAELIFWDICAPYGVRMAEACGIADPSIYRKAFVNAALDAYDRVCPKVSARQLMAYQKYRPIFRNSEVTR